MASIVSGYVYDIFISYRQKDNKHDGWVTEFVKNLKGELESTFKEEISVYFDINPHDGLLETHDVNASLKEKLKCLVFIPIISQTYCDSKSFAWQHELVAFNEIAKEDQFGRDIRLAGGNVASRILPVKIHDLDPEDKTLLENELGGVLRAIEFIYKESGVNRPLNPEDDEKKNLNGTKYRNQINKVANALKEIITALKKKTPHDGEVPKEVVKSKVDKPKKLKLRYLWRSFLILALIALGYLFIPKLFESSKPVEISIAVLPFDNMSNDPDQEFFSDGMSEEINNKLAQVPELKVAGHTSSSSFKGKNQELHTIGKQLNVNHILEGSVRKSGNKIRITAKLIKVSDGYNLWSEKYERQVEDIFDIQDEISLAILNAIKIKLFGTAKEAVLKKYTDNPEAYELYLKGRFYYNKWTLDGFNKAIDYYNAAIKRDSVYALAYAGIATSYEAIWFYNYLPSEKCLEQMKLAAEYSLKLDNEIAESHLAMARLKMMYEWDFAAAIDEYKKAIELNPNSAEAHIFYAICLGYIGKYTEAIKQASIAYSLDPFSSMINFNVSTVYWMTGDYEKEVEFGRRLVELDSNFYGGHFQVGRGLMNLKRYKAAVPELEKAAQYNYSSMTLRYLGLIYGLMGENVKTREVLEEMENLRSTQVEANADFGAVYMALGEFDNAFQYFEKAIKSHEGRMLNIKHAIRQFPEFEKDPRTKQLLEKIGLPSQ
jgi:serine/threonine-protein kinase